MNEERIKEAKLLALSMTKIKEFCQTQKSCDECPLTGTTRDCSLTDNCPGEWDVEKTLYRIGFNDGREEGIKDE